MSIPNKDLNYGKSVVVSSVTWQYVTSKMIPTTSERALNILCKNLSGKCKLTRKHIKFAILRRTFALQ